ncbi:MAG TPA: hypothetical protein PKA42_02890 [Candidatus Paceibacterota bacterium]|nr:hypothetical protein [Candidatus Paceibacterota bacterium]HMO83092.1 hypothetical protein [Candidatus Paceibacterota bacterium]
MLKDFNLQNESSDDPSVAVAGDLTDAEQEAFLDEVGTLIFKITVLRYLATISDDDALVFEAFVEVHSESGDFIDKLSAHYPEFKILLDEEIEAFQKELS